jgi:chemotaxis methyl-accepting protein methylase
LDGEAFDLVVATNILVYYDRFQQALAMTSIARMMRPGGVFLSNTVLPAQRPSALEYLGRRSVTYSASGGYGDDIVAYRRK